MAGTQVN